MSDQEKPVPREWAVSGNEVAITVQSFMSWCGPIPEPGEVLEVIEKYAFDAKCDEGERLKDKTRELSLPVVDVLRVMKKRLADPPHSGDFKIIDALLNEFDAVQEVEKLRTQIEAKDKLLDTYSKDDGSGIVQKQAERIEKLTKLLTEAVDKLKTAEGYVLSLCQPDKGDIFGEYEDKIGLRNFLESVKKAGI